MAGLRTPLCELLGIEVPIVQAPMASTSTPDLAVAVSEAGGLGSLGHAYTQPDAMRAEAAAIRARTARPFNVNLFAAPQPEEPPLAQQAEAIAAMRPVLERQLSPAARVRPTA